MYANTYIVTIYTHDKPDPERHSGQVWNVLADSAEGFGGIGKIEGFDVFVEAPRRWSLLTRKMDCSTPVFWVSRFIRRGLARRVA